VPCECHGDKTPMKLLSSLFINRVPIQQIYLCGIEFNAHEISHDTALRLALVRYSKVDVVYVHLRAPAMGAVSLSTSSHVGERK
jgi:hypothetical protein